MTYLVLARKYRPRSFDTLIGQDHVVRALTHALDTQRLHHAWLFTGTRGVGKTTLSRILAKSLNCETGITSRPCGVCQACRDIDAGRFVDYVELDAASNRGVDEMTQLLEQAVYAPSVGRFKVYMIDEVHMLTGHAFNAMLKTLEEPPAHVKFIIATTDPQKIPVTVLSRCLQFNLKQMPPDAIVGHLTQVLDEEQIPCETPALRLIAQAAGGSMRDALSLTDQAIAYSAGSVTEQAVRGMLGTIDQRHLVRLLQALGQGQAATVIEVADDLSMRGLSYSGALADLSSLLSRVAIARRVPGALDSSDPLADDIVALAAQLHPDTVQLFYAVAVHSRQELALAPDEYAGFVMACLRMLALVSDAGPVDMPALAPVQRADAGSTPVTGAPASSSQGAAAQAPDVTPLQATPQQVAPHQVAPDEATSEHAAPLQQAPGGVSGMAVQAQAAAPSSATSASLASPSAQFPSAPAGSPPPWDVSAVEHAPAAAALSPTVAPAQATPDTAAGDPAATDTAAPVTAAPITAMAAAPVAAMAAAAVAVARDAASPATSSPDAASPETAAHVTPAHGAALPDMASPATSSPEAASASQAQAGVPRASNTLASLDAATNQASVSESSVSERSVDLSPLDQPSAHQPSANPPLARQPSESAAASMPDDLPSWVSENIPDDASGGADYAFTVGADDDDEFETLSDEPFEMPAVAGRPIAPTPVVRAGKRNRLPKLTDMTAEQWPTLAASLPVTGLAAEVARQSEWLGTSDDTIRLRVAVKTLADSASRIRLQTVLCEHYGRAIRIDIAVGATGEATAHAVAQSVRVANQEAAEQAVAQDPFVNTLLSEFGAHVVPTSIRHVAGAARA